MILPATTGRRGRESVDIIYCQKQFTHLYYKGYSLYYLGQSSIIGAIKSNIIPLLTKYI